MLKAMSWSLTLLKVLWGAQTYVNECLIKRLIPFITKHHDVNNVLFWPDMATIHYVQIAIDYLKSQNVHYVHKLENALNVPQARGIERFWSLCKAAYSTRKV